MVTYSPTHRDPFRAIADPQRREIIRLLAREDLTLRGVAEHFTISRPAISKHMKILAECGLVRVERRGREHYCHLHIEKLTEITEWVELSRSLWTARLDRLENYLSELQQHKKQKESRNGS